MRVSLVLRTIIRPIHASHVLKRGSCCLFCQLRAIKKQRRHRWSAKLMSPEVFDHSIFNEMHTMPILKMLQMTRCFQYINNVCIQQQALQQSNTHKSSSSLRRWLSTCRKTFTTCDDTLYNSNTIVYKFYKDRVPARSGGVMCTTAGPSEAGRQRQLKPPHLLCLPYDL